MPRPCEAARARPLRRTVASLAVAAALLLGAPGAGAEEPEKDPLAGITDVKRRLEAAEAAERTGVDALARALVRLGEQKKAPPADLEFLLEYSVRQDDRALRMLALDAAARLDRDAAAAFFRGRADGKDAWRTALAIDALALTGGREDVPLLVQHLGSPSELIAVAAAEALAQLGTSRDDDEIVDRGLAHESSHVTDHSAWALQDLLKKPKAAADRYDRIAKKRSDPRSIRAEATVALLKDLSVEPHAWDPQRLERVRALVLAAPAEIEIHSSAPDGKYRENVQAAMDWLRETMPAAHLLVRASATRINVPGAKSDSRLDVETDAIEVPLADAMLPPNKGAYMILRLAGVLFQKRTGAPWRGHRGWEPAVTDTYDLCVVGKLYDAGPGGLTRERFVETILAQRPWGGL